jgi:hypothetical protein
MSVLKGIVMDEPIQLDFFYSKKEEGLARFLLKDGDGRSSGIPTHIFLSKFFANHIIITASQIFSHNRHLNTYIFLDFFTLIHYSFTQNCATRP